MIDHLAEWVATEPEHDEMVRLKAYIARLEAAYLEVKTEYTAEMCPFSGILCKSDGCGWKFQCPYETKILDIARESLERIKRGDTK